MRSWFGSNIFASGPAQDRSLIVPIARNFPPIALGKLHLLPDTSFASGYWPRGPLLSVRAVPLAYLATGWSASAKGSVLQHGAPFRLRPR